MDKLFIHIICKWLYHIGCQGFNIVGWSHMLSFALRNLNLAQPPTLHALGGILTCSKHNQSISRQTPLQPNSLFSLAFLLFQLSQAPLYPCRYKPLWGLYLQGSVQTFYILPLGMYQLGDTRLYVSNYPKC